MKKCAMFSCCGYWTWPSWMMRCRKDLHIFTNVGKVVQSIGCRAVVNHFPTDQQGQSVKQSVDGVSWLVDGHYDGSPMTGHSDKICVGKAVVIKTHKKHNWYWKIKKNTQALSPGRCVTYSRDYCSEILEVSFQPIKCFLSIDQCTRLSMLSLCCVNNFNLIKEKLVTLYIPILFLYFFLLHIFFFFSLHCLFIHCILFYLIRLLKAVKCNLAEPQFFSCTEVLTTALCINKLQYSLCFLPFQQEQDRVGGAGVQSRGWFIQEEDRGVDDELHTDVRPLPLSSRDPAAHLRAHLRTKTPVVLTKTTKWGEEQTSESIWTLESATLVRPSSLMRWLTRASFSLWGTEVGSRRAAEKRRFSLTVSVPMTTSSCGRKAELQVKGRRGEYSSSLVTRLCSAQSMLRCDTAGMQNKEQLVALVTRSDTASLSQTWIRLLNQSFDGWPEPRSQRGTWSWEAAAPCPPGPLLTHLKGPSSQPKYPRTSRKNH